MGETGCAGWSFSATGVEYCSLAVVLVERGLAEYLEEEVGLAEEKVNNSENEKEEEGCNATLSESFVLLQ